MFTGHAGIYDLYLGNNFVRNIHSLNNCTRQFERSLSKYLQIPYVFLLDSGRSALLIALDLLGCSNREVLVNAYTTDVVHSTIIAAGAQPQLFDINPITLEPAPDSIRQMKFDNIALIIHTGLFGLPCNPTGLLFEAQKHSIPLVEDACNSFGTRWREGLCGQYGSLAILSFRVGKPLSSGGGALLTRDLVLADKIRSRLRRVPEASSNSSFLLLLRILFDYCAFQPLVLKYFSRPLREATKGTSIGKLLTRGGVVDTARIANPISVRRMGKWQAALGLANLDQYPKRLIQRRRAGRLLVERCSDLPFTFLVNKNDNNWNGLFLPLLLPHDCADIFVDWMRKRHFDVTRFHAEAAQHSYQSFAQQNLPGTRLICDRLVCVPSTPAMLGKIEHFHTAAKCFADKHC